MSKLKTLKSFEKKSLKKAWIRKGKDVIFALPNREERDRLKSKEDFRDGAKLKKTFFQKSL